MCFRAIIFAATGAFGLWQSWNWLPGKTRTEDELVKVLERQLARCGPENLVCPVCEAHEVCSLGNQAAGVALGFCGGILVVLVFGLAFALWRLQVTPEVTAHLRVPVPTATARSITPTWFGSRSPPRSGGDSLALTLPSGILSASEVLDL